MYDREITPSTCTIFPIGAKVKITNSGRCYSTYKQMSEYMGITHKHAFNPFRNGDVGTVEAKAMHESIGYEEVLAVRVAEGVALIGASGVTEHEEPAVVDPTVEQLKTELAVVKAKLWDAEQRLKKIVAIVTE